MKRNFMFIVVIATGMALTACGGSEESVEDKTPEVTEENRTNGEGAEAPKGKNEEANNQVDDLMRQVKDTTSALVEKGKAKASEMVEEGKKIATDAVKEKVPEMVEEGKKAVGM